MQFGNEESEAIDLSSAGQHLIGTESNLFHADDGTYMEGITGGCG